MMDKLDALIAAAEKATPGPWSIDETAPDSSFIELKGKWLRDDPEAILVMADDDCPTHPVADCSCNPTCRGTDEQEANAAYIASVAPAVVIALCRVAKSVQEVMDDPELSGYASKEILAPALRDLNAALK